VYTDLSNRGVRKRTIKELFEMDTQYRDMTHIRSIDESNLMLMNNKIKACEDSEKAYFDLLTFGWTPEQARNVLIHSVKTEVVATMNLRQWRHFIEVRTDSKAHPQMREIASMLQEKLRKEVPIVFD